MTEQQMRYWEFMRNGGQPTHRWDVYLAGSLRNPAIPELHQSIEQAVNCSVFTDWYAAGPEADDYWKRYWQEQGVSYKDALKRPNSQNTFLFDKKHIDASRVMVLCAPAGKSGHLELGYFLGMGGVGLYYFPEEADVRWDVMLNFTTAVCVGENELYDALRRYLK